MIDLIDLTSPTYKEELAVTDKILATDGDNVFMVSPSGTDSETVDTMQRGIMAFDSDGKKGKLDVVGFISDFYGIDIGMVYTFFTKNPYSTIKSGDIVTAMVEKGYIPHDIGIYQFKAVYKENVVAGDIVFEDPDRFLILANEAQPSVFFDYFKMYVFVNDKYEEVGNENSYTFYFSSIEITYNENRTSVSFEINSDEQSWPLIATKLKCEVSYLLDRSNESEIDIEH